MLHELYRQLKREGVRAPATPCLLELDGLTVLGPNTCAGGGGRVQGGEEGKNNRA